MPLNSLGSGRICTTGELCLQHPADSSMRGPSAVVHTFIVTTLPPTNGSHLSHALLPAGHGDSVHQPCTHQRVFRRCSLVYGKCYGCSTRICRVFGAEGQRASFCVQRAKNACNVSHSHRLRHRGVKPLQYSPGTRHTRTCKEFRPGPAYCTKQGTPISPFCLNFH